MPDSTGLSAANGKSLSNWGHVQQSRWQFARMGSRRQEILLFERLAESLPCRKAAGLSLGIMPPRDE
jgi:hypothetical protein